jgi:hypothetical protein
MAPGSKHMGHAQQLGQLVRAIMPSSTYTSGSRSQQVPGSHFGIAQLACNGQLRGLKPVQQATAVAALSGDERGSSLP